MHNRWRISAIILAAVTVAVVLGLKLAFPEW